MKGRDYFLRISGTERNREEGQNALIWTDLAAHVRTRGGFPVNPPF